MSKSPRWRRQSYLLMEVVLNSLEEERPYALSLPFNRGFIYQPSQIGEVTTTTHNPIVLGIG